MLRLPLWGFGEYDRSPSGADGRYPFHRAWSDDETVGAGVLIAKLAPQQAVHVSYLSTLGGTIWEGFSSMFLLSWPTSDMKISLSIGRF